MVNTVCLKKGLDIPLKGAAEWSAPGWVTPQTCAIVPDDFPGITPKVDVKEGDRVAVGTPLFHDKHFPDLKVCSPAEGTVTAVVRGERRKLERIVITPDKESKSVGFVELPDLTDSTLVERMLLDTGLWAYIRQRPYAIVPRPGFRPRDIFVTAFDSAPLAPDFAKMAGDKIKELSAAVKVLSRLTSGKVYLGVRSKSPFKKVEGAEVIVFRGPHPAGNAGVQIANVKPVNKGDIVWTLDLPTLLRIGTLVSTGNLDMTTTLAVTACEVKHPCYVSTVVGADMATILKDNVYDDHVHHRYISGNALTGHPVNLDNGYLRYPYTHVTVIAEGDDCHEFMGWASMSPQKMSVNHSFPGHFMKRLFCPDARILGGRRAMILSGIYESVLPMDILPEYLVKAIIARDIDRMEKLGIYEIAPEDVALCEYIDPSKLELQKIVGEGIDYIRRELD